MGTATEAMRAGHVKSYTMEAFFFDVLVRVKCSHGLADKSDLYFYLTFEEETFLGGRTKYPVSELPDEVLDRIRKLSIRGDDPTNEKEYVLQCVRREGKMTLVRPRPSSFEGFKVEAMNALERLEEIFQILVSPHGSVMELSFGQGFRI